MSHLSEDWSYLPFSPLPFSIVPHGSAADPLIRDDLSNLEVADLPADLQRPTENPPPEEDFCLPGQWPPPMDGNASDHCAQWDKFIEQLNRESEWQIDGRYDPTVIIPIFSQKLVTAITENYAAASEQEKFDIYRKGLVPFQRELALLHSEMLSNPDWTERMRFGAADGLMECHIFAVECDIHQSRWAIPEDRKIRNLILSGGGGKGIAYPPALKILLDPIGNGDLVDFQKLKLNGTSAGGLAAAAAAFHLGDLAAICEEIQHVSMSDFAETGSRCARRYPSLRLANSPVGFSALGLVEYFDGQIGKKVRDWLRANFSDGFGSISSLSEKQIARLKKLQRKDGDGPGVDGSREEEMITFDDLALLRSIGAPFYDLALALTDESSNRGVYADAVHTPNLPIAFALRGTMSIPILFKDLSIPCRLLTPAVVDDGRWHRIGDGGMFANTPLDVSDGLNHRQRLVLVFYGSGLERPHIAAAAALIGPRQYQPPTDLLQGLKWVPDLLESAFQERLRQPGGGSIAGSFLLAQFLAALMKSAHTLKLLKRNVSCNNEQMRQIFQDCSRNIIVLQHGNVGTTDFNPTARQRRAVRLSTAISVKAHLVRLRREIAHGISTNRAQ
ncbi:MAG: patatin-like phospholipase family protein [Puniceicoccales bacterium]|jgi:predicted acylesterase/phospholipase RssA|nr:patatin-like phospholipase family protein [Puniceicoccales bacterium]